MVDSRLSDQVRGPVRIVGTGLLGTSIGLGLRACGVDVVLADASPTHLSLAVDYGAGRAADPEEHPGLVVVCVPPDVTADTVAAELAAYPDATVTDVASVKSLVMQRLLERGADTSRYVGSHPLAGRERGGPSAGRADLFLGRPWVITPPEAGDHARIRLVEAMVLDLGAAPVEMTPADHDRAVALISHVPQLVATLMAHRLLDAPPSAVNLAGQGLRDVTRIAESDPELWVQILGANGASVRDILVAYRDDLDRVIAVLAEADAPGVKRQLAAEFMAGNAGVARLPGKHGVDRRYQPIVVLVDDSPGQLARLFQDVGEAGANIEDLRLEHSPGAQLGIAEISVLPEVAVALSGELISRGWRLIG